MPTSWKERVAESTLPADLSSEGPCDATFTTEPYKEGCVIKEDRD